MLCNGGDPGSRYDRNTFHAVSTAYSLTESTNVHRSPLVLCTEYAVVIDGEVFTSRPHGSKGYAADYSGAVTGTAGGSGHLVASVSEAKTFVNWDPGDVR